MTTAISPCTILIMLIKTKNSSSNFLTAVGIAPQRLRKSLLSNTLPPPHKKLSNSVLNAFYIVIFLSLYTVLKAAICPVFCAYSGFLCLHECSRRCNVIQPVIRRHVSSNFNPFFIRNQKVGFMPRFSWAAPVAAVSAMVLLTVFNLKNKEKICKN